MTAVREAPVGGRVAGGGGLDFVVPPGLEARAPVEAEGRRRDDVRLLVSHGTAVEHHQFRDLPDLLAPGDLLVVNNSATLPAALDATLTGALDTTLPAALLPAALDAYVPAALDAGRLVVHVSTERPDGTWLIEPRRPTGDGTTAPGAFDLAGQRLRVPEGWLTVLRPYTGRLWVCRAEVPGTRASYLAAHGRPIRYAYTDRDWPLETYQNAYATEPGSAEMPSAGRPLTGDVLARLAGHGILVAPVTLHTGVASAEADEPPYPEWFAVSETTARLLTHVRTTGGRVIAVGTTVVRALESAVRADGVVRAASGFTDRVIGPSDRVHAVDGLLTGLHEPRASHLQMLTAVVGLEALRAAYAAAIEGRYRWHEFGDVHLLMRGT